MQEANMDTNQSPRHLVVTYCLKIIFCLISSVHDRHNKLLLFEHNIIIKKLQIAKEQHWNLVYEPQRRTVRAVIKSIVLALKPSIGKYREAISSTDLIKNRSVEARKARMYPRNPTATNPRNPYIFSKSANPK